MQLFHIGSRIDLSLCILCVVSGWRECFLLHISTLLQVFANTRKGFYFYSVIYKTFHILFILR